MSQFSVVDISEKLTSLNLVSRTTITTPVKRLISKLQAEKSCQMQVRVTTALLMSVAERVKYSSRPYMLGTSHYQSVLTGSAYRSRFMS